MRAYVRPFDLAQLGDLNRFFATQTGQAYAAQSLTIMTDPDVVAPAQAFITVLMKRMPDIGAKIQAATASLPKQRTYDHLSPAEKARLTKLMGQAPDTSAASGKKTRRPPADRSPRSAGGPRSGFKPH